jgi:hypothetical protein
MPREEITSDRLLTEREANEVEAALALSGVNSRSFAHSRGLEYTHLRKVISRKRVPNADCAEVLNDLLAETTWPAPGPKSTE